MRGHEPSFRIVQDSTSKEEQGMCFPFRTCCIVTHCPIDQFLCTSCGRRSVCLELHDCSPAERLISAFTKVHNSQQGKVVLLSIQPLLHLLQTPTVSAQRISTGAWRETHAVRAAVCTKSTRIDQYICMASSIRCMKRMLDHSERAYCTYC